MRLLLCVLIVAGCSADDAEDAESARRPCEELREHLIDLRLVNAQGDPGVIESHRAAMQRALGNNFVASCQQQMTAAQIRCATSAPDFAAASACQAAVVAGGSR